MSTKINGSKGEHLIKLQRNIVKYNSFLEQQNFSFLVDVPQFIIIPSTVYSEWESTTKNERCMLLENKTKWIKICLEELVTPYYNKYLSETKSHKYDDLIVRSSCVYSEDSDKMTWAGIYESVVVIWGEEICCNLTKQEKRTWKTPLLTFTLAVKSIYDSVNSEKAIKYRKQNNVTVNEQVSLVVQKYLDYGSSWSFQDHMCTSQEGKWIGYFNSLVKWQPNRIKLVRNGIAYIMDKSNLLKDLQVYTNKGEAFSHDELIYSYKSTLGRDRSIFLNPVDDSNFNSRSAYALALFFLYFEQKVGHPIQIEFATKFETERDSNEDTPFHSDSSYPSKTKEQVLESNKIHREKNKLFLLQLRSLPEAYQTITKIKFPKKQPLFVWSGIWVGSIKMKNLSKWSNYRFWNHWELDGIAVYDYSEGYTVSCGESSLPRSGGVIVVFPSDYWHGHVETLIAESENLIGVFNQSSSVYHKEGEKEEQKKYEALYKTLKEADTIEIVSDWLEARVYI